MDNKSDKLSRESKKEHQSLDKKTSGSGKKFHIFKLMLHNDVTTPMHFVVHVIQTVFKHSPAEAHALMFEAHTYGKAVVGMFPKDIADAYIHSVHILAKHHGHVLHCSKEEVQ